MTDCVIPKGYKKTSQGVLSKELDVKALGDLYNSIKYSETLASYNNDSKITHCCNFFNCDTFQLDCFFEEMFYVVS